MLDISFSKTSHPLPKQLHDFIVGKLTDEEAERIEAHVENCEVCQERLDQDSSSDPFVELVCEAESCRVAESLHRKPPPTSNRPDNNDGSARQSRVPPELSIDGYEVLEEIGRGGMGVVYRATHLALNRPVALKVILAGEHSTEAARTRFRREAETIARLRHPGIVQIYEIGEHAGRPYVALELVEGVSLRQAIGGQPQDIRWSAEVVMKLARIVEYAHQEGVIHRDLKPENVLLSSIARNRVPPINDLRPLEQPTTSRDPKVTDFGLAKEINATSDLTKSGTVAGTLPYMAPEQVGRQTTEVGPRSDIYALGVILYELLTGRKPFPSGEVLGLLTTILSDDPLPPRTLRADVPRDLETICLKCLRKDPRSRYETALEFAEDLGRFLRDEPIQAQGLGAGQRLIQWARRRPFLALAYSCSLLFYALHLFCMWVLRLPSHQGSFHWLVTGTLFAWCVVVAVLQPWLSSRRLTLPARYLYAAITVLVVTIGTTADCGPRSAPVPLFLLLIPGSSFLLPRPSMVWFTTVLAMAAYGWLNLYASRFRPECLVSAEQAIAFEMCLLVMGLLMHLTIRHVRLT